MINLWPQLLAILLCTAITTASHAASEDFAAAYKKYQEAIQAQDWEGARKMAKASLDEGLKQFDAAGENIANLRINYAQELTRSGLHDAAEAELSKALASKEALYGPDSDKIIPVLMDVGSNAVTREVSGAEKYFDRALRNARALDARVIAKLQLEAGLSLSRANKGAEASPLLQGAFQFYVDRFGAADARSGLAGLNLGKILADEKKWPEATAVLTKTVPAFQGADDVSRQFDIATRKLLVIAFEEMGKRDLATEHCVEIARRSANVNGYAKQEMLFGGRTTATRLAGRDSQGIESVGGGLSEAIVSYSIDTRGLAINIKVEQSSNSQTSRTATDIVEAMRYAPAVSDGEPVTVDGLTFHYKQSEQLTVH